MNPKDSGGSVTSTVRAAVDGALDSMAEKRAQAIVDERLRNGPTLHAHLSKLTGLAKQLAEEVVSLKRAVTELREDNAALAANLADVMQEMVTYADVWRDSESYAPNMMVTHSGQLWMAKAVSRGERPGVGKAWKLMQKH